MSRSPSARSLATLTAAAAAAAMLACGERGAGPVGPITELPRELSVVEREIVDGANAFGFDLFRLVYVQESAPNVFLSPLSASLALGMTLNGAAGETWVGMRRGLRLGDRSEQEINEGYRSLIELLYGLDSGVDFRYQAVELAYGRGAYAMTVVLPAPGVTLAELVADLDPQAWDALLATLSPVELELSLPKFQIAYDAYLNAPLIAMGMDSAFSPDADFSRLTPVGVCIQYVRQKTFVDVDEKGTRAAAVTVVSVGYRSAGGEVMRVDRPFLFAIRERFSGTILFLGTIGDPDSEAAPDPGQPSRPC